MKVKSFKLLNLEVGIDQDTEVVADEINKALQDGWSLWGPPGVQVFQRPVGNNPDDGSRIESAWVERYYQALVKYGPEKKITIPSGLPTTLIALNPTVPIPNEFTPDERTDISMPNPWLDWDNLDLDDPNYTGREGQTVRDWTFEPFLRREANVSTREVNYMRAIQAHLGNLTPREQYQFLVNHRTPSTINMLEGMQRLPYEILVDGDRNLTVEGEVLTMNNVEELRQRFLDQLREREGAAQSQTTAGVMDDRARGRLEQMLGRISGPHADTVAPVPRRGVRPPQFLP